MKEVARRKPKEEVKKKDISEGRLRVRAAMVAAEAVVADMAAEAEAEAEAAGSTIAKMVCLF